MKSITIAAASGTIGAALLAGCAGAPPRSAAVACAELPAAVAALKNVRVTASAAVADDGKGTPAHCQVSGVANERTGIDGRQYAIAFEMRLPAGWNRRFLHQVNGGNDGKVVPALGALAVWSKSALQRGFAVISSRLRPPRRRPRQQCCGPGEEQRLRPGPTGAARLRIQRQRHDVHASRRP